MIILLSILLGLSVLLNLILLYRAYVMVGLVEESMEREYLSGEYLKDTLQRLLSEMREIDIRGAFESDDEVGAVFNDLKRVIEEYEQNM